MRDPGRASNRNRRGPRTSQEKPAGIFRHRRTSPNRRNPGHSLRMSANLYRLLVEAAGQAGHGIVILQDTDDKVGAIVFVNAGVAGALGYTEHELLGMTIADLICPEDLPLVAERYARRRSGEDVPSFYELRAIRHDGTKVPLEISAVPAVIDGKVSTMAFIRDLSHQVQLAETAERSERWYRLLADNLSDVLFTVDMNLRPTYTSPSVTRLLGYSVNEADSRVIQEALTPESLPVAARLVEELLEANRGATGPRVSRIGQLEMTRKDGSTVWIEADVTLLRGPDGQPGGLLGVIRDISKRKAAEDKLRQSEEKYRTFVEASPDGILSLDRQGHIVDCSTGICKLLGYTRQQLRGADISRVLPGEAGKKRKSFAGPIARRGYSESEHEMVHRDGHKIPVWAKLVKVKGTKKSDSHLLAYIRDIEERRKVDELKDQFIGLVSHELRTPLTVVIGAVKTALSEAAVLPPQEMHQLLEDAANGADSLSDILENLLELSRSQADRLALYIEPLILGDVVRKTIDEVGRHSSTHRFVMDLPKTLPAVRADRIRLQRILHNLVENAVKYSPGGEVRVSARRRGEYVVIGVRDQGPGISPEDQAKLFQPFQRIRRSETDGVKGIGLGLLVCRRLAEAHGGRIWLESGDGRGTAFFFSLPVNGRGSERV